MWDWSWVYDCLIVNHKDTQIMAISCLEVLLNLGKEEKMTLLRRYCKIENSTDLDFLE